MNTRSEILHRGLVIWRDEGVQYLTARRLARDMGVTHGCVAYHFKGQAVLHDAIAAHAVAVRDAKMVALLRAMGHSAVGGQYI